MWLNGAMLRYHVSPPVVNGHQAPDIESGDQSDVSIILINTLILHYVDETKGY